VRGAAVEAQVERVRVRRAEDDLADRRALVVHEARARVQPRVVERPCALQAHLLLRREHELDPGVRDPLADDAADRLEHGDHGGLVVGPEDRAAGVADHPVLVDVRLELPVERHGVRVRAEEDRRSVFVASG
jgi:hypothetical protein